MSQLSRPLKDRPSAVHQRNMQMNISAVEEIAIQPQLFGARADERQCRPSRFVHHVANRASHLETFAARHARRFHKQDIATVWSPCEPGDHARDGSSLVEFFAALENRVIEIFLYQ